MKYARIADGYFYDDIADIMNDYNIITTFGRFPELWDINLLGKNPITIEDILSSLDKVEEK